MVEDALGSQRRIAMALLKDGREEPDAPGRDVYSIGGMGELDEVERLEDGRFNIVLVGRSRYRLVETLRRRPYRVARVQLLEDLAPSPAESGRLRKQLIARVARLRAPVLSTTGLDQLESMEFPQLVNTLCSSGLADEHSKQILLEMNSLKSRASAMLQLLDRQIHQESFISEFEHLRPGDVRVN